MTSYTNTFGGQTIFPAQVSIRQVTLTADVTLEWPMEMATSDQVVAWIMDVSASSGGLSITMPPANETSSGQSILFNNIGANTFTVKNNAGTPILTVAAGIAWDLWIYDNSTAAGLWRTSQRGAAAASVNVAGLAGPGIVTIGTTLGQSMPVTGLSSDYDIGDTDRAKFFIWTGGAGDLTLPSGVGNNWFVTIRNEGTGVVTITPTAGTVNGVASLDLQPNDSATFAYDATNYFTAGLGQAATFAFDYIEIDITGGGNYTLTGAQLNRIAYKFVGVLAADRDIIVPATTQQYWVNNATTGAFVLGVRTSVQPSPGVTVLTGEQSIMYCDGTSVIDGDSSGIVTPIAISDGGTGATTANGALVNLGGTSVGIAVFNAANAGVGRTALGSTTVGDAVFIAANAAAARSALALGSMSTQDATAVAVTGGTLAGITSAETISTDAGAGIGPTWDTFRNSASPATDDLIGGLRIYGNSSTGVKRLYAHIRGQIGVTTNAAEYGRIEFYNLQNGVDTFGMELASGLIMAGAGSAQGVGTVNATELYRNDQKVGTPVAFSVHKNGTDQTAVPTATDTLVTFSTETYDIGGYFASNRFTPLVPGIYHFTAAVNISVGIVDQQLYQVKIYKNGSTYRSGDIIRGSGSGDISAILACDVSMNGTTDYVQIYVYGGGAGDKTLSGLESLTWFMGHRVGPNA